MKNNRTYIFLENSLSLFSVKGIELLVTVLLIPYILLKVGIVNYGKYAFAFALILVLVNIANYGFNINAVRETAKKRLNRKELQKVFNEVFSVKLYLTLFLLCCLLIAVLFIPTLSSDKLLFLFSGSYLIAEVVSLRWLFLGTERMKFIPAIQLVAALLYALLVIVFVSEPSDYIYIVFFEAVGVFIAGFVSFLYVISVYKLKLQLLSLNEVVKYLVVNFSSFINLFIPSVMSNLAIFLVGVFGMPANIGFVQLGIKVSNAFSTVNATITKVYFSMVNKEKQLFRKAAILLLSIGVIFSLLMFLSADFIVSYWLNNQDIEIKSNVSLIIKLLSPTPFLMAMISTFGVNGLLVLSKDIVFLKITLLSLVLGLVVGLVTQPKYGYLSGILFLLITRGVLAFVSMVYFNRTNSGKFKIGNF